MVEKMRFELTTLRSRSECATKLRYFSTINQQNQIKIKMEDDKKNIEAEKKEWWDENMSHGAFAYTQEEIDFYFKKKQ